MKSGISCFLQRTVIIILLTLSVLLINVRYTSAERVVIPFHADPDVEGGEAARDEPFSPFNEEVNRNAVEGSAAGLEDEDEGPDSSNQTLSNCSTCELRENRRILRLEMIKQDVMRKLKIVTLPRLNGSRPNLSALPEDLLEMTTYSRRQEDEQRDEDSFKTIIFGSTRESPSDSLLFAHDLI